MSCFTFEPFEAQGPVHDDTETVTLMEELTDKKNFRIKSISGEFSFRSDLDSC